MKDKERKVIPVYSILEFWPLAMKELAKAIQAGQSQHINNETESPVWDRSKSNQHMQSLTRHLLDYANGEELDEDKVPHLAKVAWRALSQLQMDCEDFQSSMDEDSIIDTLKLETAEEIEAAEERMNIIGRNGNTGDHYDALNSINESKKEE